MKADRSTKPRICRWPHCGMSREGEQQLELLIQRHARFIARMAQRVAEDGTVHESDLVQEAMIVLWRIGPARAALRGEAFVRGAVCRRMKKVRLDEWRRWGRGKQNFQSEV